MATIRRDAYAMGREMIWSATAQRYLESFQHARANRRETPSTAFAGWTLEKRPYELPPLRLDHIVRMSDGTSIFQHAIFNVPNFHEGYCIDDTARAFILCTMLDEIGKLAASWRRAISPFSRRRWTTRRVAFAIS